MRHLHPLFSGNQWLIKDNPEMTQDFINIYLKESTSISEYTDSETDRLFDIIKDDLKNKSLFNIRTTTIEKYNCDYLIYKKHPIEFLYNEKCKLNLTLININDDISNDELKRICRQYGIANIIREKGRQTPYTLTATLILNKMELSKYIKSDISHELRHMYVYLKTIESDGDVVSNKKINWEKIYNYCQEYLHSNEKKYGEEFYKIIYAIYSCDKEEIDSFTQQAYTEVKGSDRCEIKRELEKTDLWDVILNIKEVIDILNKSGYKEKYITLRKYIGNEKLPSFSDLKSLLLKRYKKGYTNYGKLIIRLMDEFEEDLIDEGIKSDSRDGLFINPYYIM